MTAKPNNGNANKSDLPASAGGSEIPAYVIAKQQKANMIRKMLYYGYEMGWDRPRTRPEEILSKQQLCWNHVQAWCKSPKCSIRKTLNRYTVEELTKVVSQFELVYESFKKDLKKQEP
jgi:hypothetical protein